jgi:hypothetical protein
VGTVAQAIVVDEFTTNGALMWSNRTAVAPVNAFPDTGDRCPTAPNDGLNDNALVGMPP